jgi:anti-sigma-K factor RskA
MSPQHEDHRRTCGADVAAYALGALEPAEAEAFRRHLESCSVCAHELTSLRQVVDELPVTAPRYRATPQLRRRVLNAVANEAASTRDDDRRRWRWRWRSPRSRSRPGLASGAIAAACAAIAVVVVLLVSGGGSSQRVITAQVSGPGRAVLRVAHGHGQLLIRGMPAPPRGKIYEVWVQHRERPPSPTSALFSVTSAGDGDVDVPGNLRGVSRVMVTPEPAGGSRVPTHAPVIVATLGATE